MGITTYAESEWQTVAAGDTDWGVECLIFNAIKYNETVAAGRVKKQLYGGTGSTSLATIAPTAGWGVSPASGSNATYTLAGGGVFVVTGGPIQPSVSIQAATGVAGGYSYAGDTTTLWYRAAAGEMRARTSGKDAVTINATQQVTVQSAEATTLLEVDNTATDGDPSLAFSLSGTKVFTLGVDDGDSDKFKIGTTAIDTNTRLTINAAGKVGIGTTSPASHLHVNAGTDTAIARFVTTPGATMRGAGFHGDDTGNGRAILWLDVNGGDFASSDYFRLQQLGAQGGTELIVQEAAPLSFWTNGVQRMSITSGGNIGVRTTSPDGSFHIHTATAGTVVADSDADELVLENSTNAGLSILTPATAIGRITFGDTGSPTVGQILYNHSTDQLSVVTSGTTRGYVGAGFVMGSPSGGDKGAGTINATAVYDDNVLLTDFVFEPEYKMMSIVDMRRYYERHLHLPTIPGRVAWEKEKGFSVGKLATYLWETVEVHARYIAELDTRLSRLSVQED